MTELKPAFWPSLNLNLFLCETEIWNGAAKETCCQRQGNVGSGSLGIKPVFWYNLASVQSRGGVLCILRKNQAKIIKA